MKKLQLLLTNPCTENWDAMQPSKAGRYCDSCTKHIVDLTDKTDAELIAFFKKKKDNICGRLLSSQLQRDLVVPPQKSNWQWLLPIALGALSIANPFHAIASDQITFQTNDIDPQDHLPPSHNVKTKSSKTGFIKITVLAADNDVPLRGVKIKNKRFKNVIASTDVDGVFELPFKKGDIAEPIVFEAVGYQILERMISTDTVVKMQPIRVMIGAVVSVTTDNKPLYVITAGNKSCIASDLQSRNILPEWIEKIDILKDASTTAIYGARGANGVILVEIKKKYAKRIDFSKKD